MDTHPSLEDQVTPLLKDLYYPSESDEPVEFISCYLNQPEPLTTSQVKDWQMVPPDVYVEEIPEEQFWQPVVTGQEWYDDTEKARTERFRQLRQLLEQHLTDRQAFRVGSIEVDLLLIGKQPDGERAGIKTKVVET